MMRRGDVWRVSSEMNIKFWIQRTWLDPIGQFTSSGITRYTRLKHEWIRKGRHILTIREGHLTISKSNDTLLLTPRR